MVVRRIVDRRQVVVVPFVRLIREKHSHLELSGQRGLDRPSNHQNFF